jgi:hypothetical protein
MTYKRRHGVAIVDTEEGILVVQVKASFFFFLVAKPVRGNQEKKQPSES